MKPVLYVVVPCYNEEKVLPITSQLFLDEINLLIEKEKISPNSRIMFVNDGSRDSTWSLIEKLAETDEHFIGISQSRNRGHQNAVLAGLMEAKDMSDITISIDCDGQDDITAMEKMVDSYLEGHDVVYGVRSKRDTDTFFKRFTAESFYKILALMGVEVVFNHADYRLLSSRVLQEFSEYKEVNLFLRGLIPLVGFESDTVAYERNERMAGESHYPLSKMLSLAFDGITSLSIKPIRMVLFIGIILAAVGCLGGLVSLMCGVSIPFICFVVCLFTGINLIGLGVVGEYVGKIYMEVKARPRYIISRRTYDKTNDENKEG
ncbi:MAG: glycosyltransferase family 2 protein [Ruminococcaceae bacterium]|nr:glycosyltransferase family 2 protein [Oscillospiraceae bacterium]MBQ9912921.1 glycosyltransferase family 2 protein [Clostridia bacterium]